MCKLQSKNEFLTWSIEATALWIQDKKPIEILKAVKFLELIGESIPQLVFTAYIMADLGADQDRKYQLIQFIRSFLSNVEY